MKMREKPIDCNLAETLLSRNENQGTGTEGRRSQAAGRKERKGRELGSGATPRMRLQKMTVPSVPFFQILVLILSWHQSKTGKENETEKWKEALIQKL